MVLSIEGSKLAPGAGRASKHVQRARGAVAPPLWRVARHRHLQDRRKHKGAINHLNNTAMGILLSQVHITSKALLVSNYLQPLIVARNQHAGNQIRAFDAVICVEMLNSCKETT
eukprot:181164-Pleurochrysis_carterae.AAC.1